MKIAAVTEDGITISQHFGRAPFYMVVTVENNKVIHQEKRSKTGHHDSSSGACHDDHASHGRHGHDASAESIHTTMAQAIDDCQILIAGGMGWGAYESLKRRNIESITTDIESIDKAVKLYMEGKLPNLMNRLH
jgi:predicted Fe-Mo cluster-binding NifX family protein